MIDQQVAMYIIIALGCLIGALVYIWIRQQIDGTREQCHITPKKR